MNDTYAAHLKELISELRSGGSLDLSECVMTGQTAANEIEYLLNEVISLEKALANG